jgi:hypothetical protein
MPAEYLSAAAVAARLRTAKSTISQFIIDGTLVPDVVIVNESGKVTARGFSESTVDSIEIRGRGIHSAEGRSWEAWGPVRGSCGHRHRTREGALRCCERDQSKVEREHGEGYYSDQRPRIIKE